jgi:hypothetical protein
MFSRRALCLIVGLGLIAGCGPRLPARKGTVEVNGKIIQANGEPAKLVALSLEPTEEGVGMPCSGMTDENGVISLRTYEPESYDGAVPATYTMKIETSSTPGSTRVSESVEVEIEDGKDLEIKLTK